MTAYYNEFDPDAAAWLRELIADGLIAPGDVDERSIIDVSANDIKGYDQHHWFAGIGCWSYALRLADWPDDKSVWTASLPCQPFSIAGKQLGKQDERHLLPHFLSLVAQCRPSILFGEQVSAAIKHGWLDDLYAEMEAHNYSVGSVVIGAHSIGAAHIRQRLYWVADNCGEGCQEQPSIGRIPPETNDSDSRKDIERGGRMGNTEHNGRSTSQIEGCHGTAIQHSATRSNCSGEPQRTGTSEPLPWEWLYCRDNKYRPIESSTIWLVNGYSCRMVQGCDKSIAHIETNEKEINNANRNPGEILSKVQYQNGEETLSERTRGHGYIPEKEVLQSSMYGEGLRRCDEDEYNQEQSSTIEESGKRGLRGVWENTHIACSSCGRESFKQFPLEFDDVVRAVPPGSTLAKFLGSDGSEYMQTLRQTGDEDWALLDAQYTAKEVWESLTDEEKDRIRIHFNNGNWIFTERLKPLVDVPARGMVHSGDSRNTQEARKMRLKGYGNAIVPALAAEFIMAYTKSMIRR